MKHMLISICVALTLAQELFSQTPSPAVSATPPLPPLIKRAPDKVQWVISYKVAGPGIKTHEAQQQAGKTVEPPARQKIVIKNQNLVFERTINENGAALDTWYLPPALAVSSSQGKSWTLASASSPGFESTNYASEDFAGFEWISQQNFKGLKEVNGRPCLVFQDRVVTIETAELEILRSDINRDFSWLTLNENGASTKGSPKRTFNIEDYKNPVVAYIDEQTRLPVALVYKCPAGTVTRTYQFQPAPATLQLPPEAQVILNTSAERQRRMSAGHAPI